MITLEINIYQMQINFFNINYLYKNIQIHHLDITKNINKERLQKEIMIFLKKKKKRRPYGREQYKNLPEDEKQRLIEYRKKIKSD